MNRFFITVVVVNLVACGGTSTPLPAKPASGHGTVSTLSVAKSKDAKFCEHRVPLEVCTRHNPQLVAQFKESGDWCAEHSIPESQCYECHPDLSFEPLPEVPLGADLKKLSERGEDVLSLAAHVVPGKVTVFDFYADWCAPCRKIDAHLYTLLQERSDLAIRKLNVVSWDTAIAARYLKKVAKLPYVVVYGKDGTLVGEVIGLDLVALDKAITEGRTR